jgi:hypothetical protein
MLSPLPLNFNAHQLSHLSTLVMSDSNLGLLSKKMLLCSLDHLIDDLC